MEFSSNFHLYENSLMKLILFSALFLLTATNSVAQTSVADTAIHIRRGVVYYIDGIKVQEKPSFPTTNSLNKRCPISPIDFNMDAIKKNSRLIQFVKTDSELVLETIEIIIGGLPGTYGDMNNNIFQINTAPVKTISPKVTVSRKEQKLATE